MDLQDFCKLHGGKLLEPLAWDIMVQVVQAARHCCAGGVFHDDIKPGNILINTQTLQVKMIDSVVANYLRTHCPGKSVIDME